MKMKRYGINRFFTKDENCNSFGKKLLNFASLELQYKNKSYEETERERERELVGKMDIVNPRTNPDENMYCRHKLSSFH